MVVTWNEGIQAKLEHEGEYLDQVKHFKFLGSYKSADGDCTNEIKRRIAMARQKAVELTTISLSFRLWIPQVRGQPHGFSFSIQLDSRHPPR